MTSMNDWVYSRTAKYVKELSFSLFNLFPVIEPMTSFRISFHSNKDKFVFDSLVFSVQQPRFQRSAASFSHFTLHLFKEESVLSFSTHRPRPNLVNKSRLFSDFWWKKQEKKINKPVYLLFIVFCVLRTDILNFSLLPIRRKATDIREDLINIKSLFIW